MSKMEVLFSFMTRNPQTGNLGPVHQLEKGIRNLNNPFLPEPPSANVALNLMITRWWLYL